MNEQWIVITVFTIIVMALIGIGEFAAITYKDNQRLKEEITTCRAILYKE